MPETTTGKLLEFIPVAGQIAGGLIDSISQGVQNRAQRKWNEKMYARQRADALADYNMQNLYNSPAEQMKRLKAAGLNPNLVYGNGATATSSQGVRSSGMQSWNPQAPKYGQGIANASLAYYQSKQMAAGTANLEEQNQLLKSQRMKTSAETLKTISETDINKFDLEMRNKLKDFTIEAARLANIQTAGKIDLQLQEYEIKEVMKQPNLDKAMQEVVNLKKDEIIKVAQAALANSEIPIKQQELLLKQWQVEQGGLETDILRYAKGIKKVEYENAVKRGVAKDWPGILKFANDVIQGFIDDLKKVGNRK